MAKRRQRSEWRRGRVWRGWAAGVLVAMVAAGCGGGASAGGGAAGATSGEAAGARAKALFEECRRGAGHTLESRMEAAEELAGRAEGEAWIVVLLTDPAAMDGAAGGEVAAEIRESLAPFDAAVVVRLLRGLPDTASREVLLAVSSRLADTQEGRYSTREGVGPLARQVDRRTPPVREVAREVLVRATGEDHGFDVEGWREAIGARGEGAAASDGR